MEQNAATTAELVSTIVINQVKPKRQDKEGTLDDQKPLNLLN